MAYFICGGMPMDQKPKKRHPVISKRPESQGSGRFNLAGNSTQTRVECKRTWDFHGFPIKFPC